MCECVKEGRSIRASPPNGASMAGKRRAIPVTNPRYGCVVVQRGCSRREPAAVAAPGSQREPAAGNPHVRYVCYRHGRRWWRWHAQPGK
ncbi:unnamed protein product, partial [Phaeothamnion confervicola]